MATRSEELARLERELREAHKRLETAENEVPWTLRGSPSLDPKLRRLQKAVVAAARAYNRLENDHFPPEFADCVEGYDMYMGEGPNQMKIRAYGSKGKWRKRPVDPLDEPPLAA